MSLNMDEVERVMNHLHEIFKGSERAHETTACIISLALTTYVGKGFPQGFLEACYETSRVLIKLTENAPNPSSESPEPNSTLSSFYDETAGMSEEELTNYLEEKGAELLAGLGIEGMGKA